MRVATRLKKVDGRECLVPSYVLVLVVEDDVMKTRPEIAEVRESSLAAYRSQAAVNQRTSLAASIHATAAHAHAVQVYDYLTLPRRACRRCAQSFFALHPSKSDSYARAPLREQFLGHHSAACLALLPYQPITNRRESMPTS